MTKKTHVCVSIAATLPIILAFKNPYLIFGLLGSTIPDIDLKLGIKHRTITHSILALLMSSLVLAILDMPTGLIWGLNYSIHLLLDSFTKTGVPLFYPYIKNYYGLKLIRTGEAEDLFICLVAILIIVSLVK